MNFRLGNIELPLPETISTTSGQYVVVFDLPDGQTVTQNLGPKTRMFQISGVLEAKNALAYAEQIENLKRESRPVSLILGDIATEVHIEDFRWALIQRGHIRYSLSLVETERQPFEVQFIPLPSAPLEEARKAAEEAREMLQSHPSLDPMQALSRALWNIEQRLFALADTTAQYRSLIELPLRLLRMLEGHLTFVLTEFDVILTHLESVLNASDRFTVEAEAAARRVLCMLRGHKDKLLRVFQQVKAIPPTDRKYRVHVGDTLASIALKFYGSAARWQDIAVANDIVDPGDLTPGQELLIPADFTGAVSIMEVGCS